MAKMRMKVTRDNNPNILSRTYNNDRHANADYNIGMRLSMNDTRSTCRAYASDKKKSFDIRAHPARASASDCTSS